VYYALKTKWEGKELMKLSFSESDKNEYAMYVKQSKKWWVILILRKALL